MGRRMPVRYRRAPDIEYISGPPGMEKPHLAIQYVWKGEVDDRTVYLHAADDRSFVTRKQGMFRIRVQDGQGLHMVGRLYEDGKLAVLKGGWGPRAVAGKKGWRQAIQAMKNAMGVYTVMEK